MLSEKIQMHPPRILPVPIMHPNRTKAALASKYGIISCTQFWMPPKLHPSRSHQTPASQPYLMWI